MKIATLYAGSDLIEYNFNAENKQHMGRHKPTTRSNIFLHHFADFVASFGANYKALKLTPTISHSNAISHQSYAFVYSNFLRGLHNTDK